MTGVETVQTQKGLARFRRGGASDEEAIRALTRAAYAKWVPLIGREPGPMTADYAAALRAHRFDLLELDSELLALIETAEEEGVLLIENIAVRPTLQGQGLGRRLLQRAEAIAIQGGRRRLRLYTNERFTENLALYRRVGYQTHHEEIRPTGVVVHMTKILDQESAPVPGASA